MRAAAKPPARNVAANAANANNDPQANNDPPPHLSNISCDMYKCNNNNK